MLNTISTKLKCDAKDCKNEAKFFFETKGRSGKCFLCESCLNAILAEGRRQTVPKSPQNTMKKRLDRWAEEANNG